MKLFVVGGLSVTKIRTKKLSVLQEIAPSFPTVHWWVQSLNAVVQALKINHVLDDQKLQKYQKSLNKYTIRSKFE